MKQKRLNKKLNLNKKTIAGLDDRQINAAYGGIDLVNTVLLRTCHTCSPQSTCTPECPECATGDAPTCPFPETEDPTATFIPPYCACCR